jgi:hypothetical protein
LPRLLATAALACAAPAAAADLLSSETLSLTGKLSLAATDGEESWVDGGFGKLGTSGSGGDLRIGPQLSEANLVWQPRFGWALSGTVVGTLHGGERTEAGISEAFLSFKPLSSAKTRFSARAGLMWPPVSLEHEGADWRVRDTITPSAINSWIGEEVRPAAIEATVTRRVGAHQLSATAAVIAANDTSGTLLTFRGWALHDRKTLAFRRQPLPPLPEAIEYYQPRYSHPLLDVGSGFARRPGYYAKLAWAPPVPIRLELFRYDNRADAEVVNADLEWGWRTAFDNAGAMAELGGGNEIRVQAMRGRTRMGITDASGIWVDNRFRSAFALFTHRFGKSSVAGRIEAFASRQHGSLVGRESDEDGWAATIAGKRQIGPFSALVELLHVESDRAIREELNLEPDQRQTRVRADLRLSW